MAPPYAPASRLASLVQRQISPSDLPGLLVLSDPQRTPDLLGLASELPPGSALIYRHFGEANRLEKAYKLAEICRRRQARLLVSADPDLALSSGADGVHWPEKRLDQAFRSRKRNLWFTASAHSRRAMGKAQAAGINAVLLSPILASNSPSAKHAIGPLRARLQIRSADLPVYMLGGMNAQSIQRLKGSGAEGFAMIEGYSDCLRARSD